MLNLSVVSHLLWNLSVHYCVCYGLPLIPIHSHMNPVHTLPWLFPKVNFNIILPSMPESSKWPLSFRLFSQSFVCTSYLSCALYVLHPSHPPWLYLVKNAYYRASHSAFLSSLLSLHASYVRIILLSTLSDNTLLKFGFQTSVFPVCISTVFPTVKMCR